MRRTNPDTIVLFAPDFIARQPCMSVFSPVPVWQAGPQDNRFSGYPPARISRYYSRVPDEKFFFTSEKAMKKIFH
jgi:hypothetical protein